MRLVKFCFLFLIINTLPLTANADWRDYISDIKQHIKDESDNGNILSEETIVRGLKQALNKGIDKSVKKLGAKNGFLKDARVKIPMPDSLRKVEKGLRKTGQDKYADRFVNTMNHAAEQAVSKTTNILLSAVKNMTLNDAINILNGKQDAATQYFKKTSTQHLRRTIKPIVTTSTNSVGLTETYKKMVSRAGFLARYIDKDSLDIDQYITNKAVDALFLKIADEEKRIREEPIARTTDLLEDVFGSLGQ